MSCYKMDDPVLLKRAISSVYDSSVLPTEFVLVEDGVLTSELDKVIEEARAMYTSLKVLKLPENLGLGIALNAGLKYCTNELVARMDSDDLNIPSRFELQLKKFEEVPELDVVGGLIQEFDTEEGDTLRKNRLVPECHADILTYSMTRNPVNHVTVMFKKSKVLDVGSYEDFPLFEDYFLWLKMLNARANFYNIQKVLVRVRAGKGMVGRRYGLSYARKEYYFYHRAYQRGFFNVFSFLKAVFLRVPLRLLPKGLLEFLYYNLFRK
ncbi:glycosyltransferase [Roseivirga sp. UBA838]|uniref:glycosyltransferase n=1 Tax=Roseivirga sp. UBA838 TaxID=1947393 RepID=UPI00257D231E|nr:glycosyltransferase [Roseivirga sp. UBA838]